MYIPTRLHSHPSQSSYSSMPFLLLLLLILFNISVIKPLNFTFDSFSSDICSSDESSLICWGSVLSTNGSLYLTSDQQQQQQENKIGRVLFRYPIKAWPASFSIVFTVKFLTNSTVSGDGMAFVIAQDDQPSPPESFGSYIGILDPSTEGGLYRQLAVELDSYRNEHEPDDNHVAIVTTSIEYPVAIKSLNTAGINLKSGKDITFEINYNGWTKLLQISASYAGNPLIDLLNQKILIENTVPESSYVGFTASTAYFSETHQLLNWNFTSYDLPRKSLNQGAERKRTRIIVSVVVPTLVGFGLCYVIVAIRRRKEIQKTKKEDMEMLTRNAANAPKFFDFKKLSKATRNFHKDNLLGAGGFGCVYKGVISDPSSIIAVKKINATSGQGEREYLAEICTIGRLRHKNLVQLQGWCHEKEQLFLVYEYMPNGSLDRYIGKIFLDWKTRYNILLGLASALLYLHEECGNPVVHRDVKPNNVMLDSDYTAHLGDFGLARLLQSEDFVTTMVAGTPGYMAPEVSYTGRATPESDVYSFGMVILEVVCGKRSRGMMDENSLVDHVWILHENDDILGCVDEKLDGMYDEEQMKRTILVGLACLHPDHMFRPRIRKVVQIFINPDEPLMKMSDSRPTVVNLSLSSHNSDSTTITCTSYHNSKKHFSRSSIGSLPDEISVRFDES